MAKKKLEVVEIPIDKIVPNTWNPNVMDDETFNRLAEEIQDVGMIDPIQVVPIEGEEEKYMILGGEHRWRVMKVLGYETIPCIVLTDEKFKDADLQKFITLRLNVIRGKIDPIKFRDLYVQLAERYSDEALQRLMGFTDQSAWRMLVGDIQKSLKSAGMPKEMIEELEKVKEDIRNVDNLALILNKMFTQYGNDLKWSFMVFTWGGQDHLWVKMNDKVKRIVDDVKKICREKEVDINLFFEEFFSKISSDDVEEVKSKIKKEVVENEGDTA